MAFSSPLRALGLALLLPCVALAQDVELNTITAVNVRGGTVEIVGTKKPNFTTFTMTDPSRLVIDISEAVFSGVPEDLQVGNGTITAIRTASYGSDASAIARVLVGFEREVETDIQAQDGRIVVKVLGGGEAAVAAAAPASGAADQPAAAQPASGEAQAVAAQAAPAEAAEQERLARQQAEAEAARAAEQEKQRQEAEARAQAEAQAAAEEQRKRQEAEAQAQAAAGEERKRQEAMAQAQADDARKQQEEEAARLEAEARAQAEAEARAKSEARAQAKAEAEERKRQEAEARAQAKAEAEERKRQEAEARAQAKAEAAARAREEREAEAQRRAEARAEAQARRQEEAGAQQQEEAGDAVQPAVASGAEVSSRRKTVALVGFKQEAASSRVFVRTDQPVRFHVSEGGERTLVLELENTRLGPGNNRRALETAYFDTAVARVTPRPGPGRTVRVEITLKESVPYQAHQEGNVVSLEFPRAGR